MIRWEAAVQGVSNNNIQKKQKMYSFILPSTFVVEFNSLLSFKSIGSRVDSARKSILALSMTPWGQLSKYLEKHIQ